MKKKKNTLLLYFFASNLNLKSELKNYEFENLSSNRQLRDFWRHGANLKRRFSIFLTSETDSSRQNTSYRRVISKKITIHEKKEYPTIWLKHILFASERKGKRAQCFDVHHFRRALCRHSHFPLS